MNSFVQLNIEQLHGIIIREILLAVFVNLRVKHSRIVDVLMREVTSVKLRLEFEIEEVLASVPSETSLASLG